MSSSSQWKVEFTPNGRINIYQDIMYRIYTYHIDKAHDYIRSWAGPSDTITYAGPGVKKFKITLKQLIEVLDGKIKTLSKDK